MENHDVHTRRRIARLTVDIDKPSRFKLLRAWFNANYFFSTAPKDLRQTGKGFHLRIHQPNLSVETNMAARRNLCDDWGRLRFDELRIHAKNVFVKSEDGKWRLMRDDGLLDWVDTAFQHKFREEWTREQPYNVLCEAFYTKLPARKGLYG